jgi:hemerythrin-like domain-containing protein
MRQHLETHIKPMLAEHPALGAVLDAAGIGCTGCSLGTCRVKDILEIHNLDPDASHALLTRMGAIIHAGRPFEVPVLERKAAPAKSTLCPPIARMVEEHTHILKVIGLIPELTLALERNPAPALELLGECLGFIRTYADRYHHAKEEDILFRFFDPESEIIGVMFQDHCDGRQHMAAMAAAIGLGDAAAAAAGLRAYGELLRGHIHREDHILYPWMDRTLTMRQVGELFQRCAAVEAAFGEQPKQHEAFAAALEGRLLTL